MKTTKILATAVLTLAATGAQASSLVINGSFEDPVQVPMWHVYYGSEVTGWTPGQNGIEIQKNGTVGGVSAFDGNQYVELDAYRNSSMWQYLETTADSIYTLNFAYMARPDNLGGRDSNFIEVWWDGIKLSTFTGKNTVGPWLEVEFANLTATSSSTRLEFRAVGTDDGYGGFIDGAYVTAVPEPESYALLLAGFGLMGTLARRRNKSKAD